MKGKQSVARGFKKSDRHFSEVNLLTNIRDELLEEQIQERLHVKACECHNIEIEIEDIFTQALIDSGSEITAISEEFFN